MKLVKIYFFSNSVCRTQLSFPPELGTYGTHICPSPRGTRHKRRVHKSIPVVQQAMAERAQSRAPEREIRGSIPARAYWMQRSNLTRKIPVLSDHRSQTVRAWLVLVGNPEYCCVWPKLVPDLPTWQFLLPLWAQSKTNHGAGFVRWWCVVSGLYSQGWEDGDQMVVLPIALTAPSPSMENVASGPSTYIHTEMKNICFFPRISKK